MLDGSCLDNSKYVCTVRLLSSNHKVFCYCGQQGKGGRLGVVLRSFCESAMPSMAMTSLVIVILIGPRDLLGSMDVRKTVWHCGKGANIVSRAIPNQGVLIPNKQLYVVPSVKKEKERKRSFNTCRFSSQSLPATHLPACSPASNHLPHSCFRHFFVREATPQKNGIFWES